MMKLILLTMLLFVLSGCQSSFLDVKPSTQSVVPSTLEELGLLLNDLNTFRSNTPNTVNVIASDEYDLSEARYNAFSPTPTTAFQLNAYTWNETVYTGEETRTDWSAGYKRILQCNVVLDGLRKLQPTDQELSTFNGVKGAALFHRAFSYYHLSQVYCSVFDTDEKAKLALGLPIRREADPTLIVGRSTLWDTYRFIEEDLLNALSLIPEQVIQVSKVDPTRAACMALLVRLYMQKADYTKAEKHARDCMNTNYSLMDYAKLSTGSTNPFSLNGKDNTEVIFLNYLPSLAILSETNQIINQNVLALYESTDLRLPLYFKENKGNKVFKGSYSGSANFPFTGLALDEVYLNLIECLARRGESTESLALLNELRKNRYKPTDFVAFEGLNADEILLAVMDERRRELILRGTRWEDLRRLNKEEKFKQALTRFVGSTVYSLMPSANRWVWPLPPAAIANGDYTQNDRK